MSKQGIQKEFIKQYWESTIAVSGDLTVGYYQNIDEQAAEYRIKTGFVLPKLNTELITVDFGCGTGNWSKFFVPNNYIGVDLTLGLLSVAEQNNTEYNYKLLSDPCFNEAKHIPKNMEQFFTSTVLQHCDDKAVSCIFKNVAKRKKTGFKFCLYENLDVQKMHVRGRSTIDYVNLICKHFRILSVSSHTHVVHGEPHTLSIIEV